VATEKWVGSLNRVAERIRRSIGWTSAGGILLDLPRPPLLTPVLLADDGTRPGTAAQQSRGRRWAAPFRFEDVAIGQSAFGIIRVSGSENGAGVIVRRLMLSAEQEFHLIVGIVPNGGTLPALAFAKTCAECPNGAGMIEQLRNSADLAPLTMASTLVTTANTYFRIVSIGIGEGADARGMIHHVPLDVYLSEGDALIFGNMEDGPVAEVDFQINLFGENF